MDSLDEKEPILYNHNNVLFQSTCRIISLGVLSGTWEKRHRDTGEIIAKKKTREIREQILWCLLWINGWVWAY